MTKIVHAVDVYSHRWYSGAASEIVHAVYVYNLYIIVELRAKSGANFKKLARMRVLSGERMWNSALQYYISIVSDCPTKYIGSLLIIISESDCILSTTWKLTSPTTLSFSALYCTQSYTNE